MFSKALCCNHRSGTHVYHVRNKCCYDHPVVRSQTNVDLESCEDTSGNENRGEWCNDHVQMDLLVVSGFVVLYPAAFRLIPLKLERFSNITCCHYTRREGGCKCFRCAYACCIRQRAADFWHDRSKTGQLKAKKSVQISLSSRGYILHNLVLPQLLLELGGDHNYEPELQRQRTPPTTTQKDNASLQKDEGE